MMKLKVHRDIIAVVKVDLKSFKNKLGKSWNMKDAIYSSSKIIESNGIAEDDILRAVHLALDWGAIIDFFQSNSEDSMLVQIYKCEYKDRLKYRPGVAKDDGEITFQESKESGIDLFIRNSFIKHPDHNIKRFIDNATYTYGDTDWKIEIVLDEKQK